MEVDKYRTAACEINSVRSKRRRRDSVWGRTGRWKRVREAKRVLRKRTVNDNFETGEILQRVLGGRDFLKDNKILSL